jgi:hypothetical protein
MVENVHFTLYYLGVIAESPGEKTRKGGGDMEEGTIGVLQQAETN